jgi:ABC-2 type transport system permease protein
MNHAEADVETSGGEMAKQMIGMPTRGKLNNSSLRKSEYAEDARALHPLLQLTLARLREFVREPEAVFWVFLFPVLLACALGIAFRNTPPEKARVAIEATNPQAETIRRALEKSSDVEALILSPKEAASQLRSGTVALVISAANDSAQVDANTINSANISTAGATTNPAIVSSPVSALTYRYDPTRPASRMARLVADDALQRALGRRDVTQAKDAQITEVGARYIDFLIPGLIGMNLMSSAMWGLGFSIVSARARKLLKLYASTPMCRSHYLLSFILSRFCFLALEILVIYGFAHFAFGVVMQGSPIVFAFFALLGTSAFAGLGLLIAARPKTIEGVSGLINFVMLPMWLMSGSLFPSSRFPNFMQPFIKILPLTSLNDGLRAVMNGSASIAANWHNALILAIWATISFFLALRLFRWQ